MCTSPFSARNNRVLEIVTFGIDTFLVLCMLVGLRGKENHGPSSGLWGLLHRQVRPRSEFRDETCGYNAIRVNRLSSG